MSLESAKLAMQPAALLRRACAASTNASTTATARRGFAVSTRHRQLPKTVDTTTGSSTSTSTSGGSVDGGDSLQTHQAILDAFHGTGTAAGEDRVRPPSPTLVD